MIYDIMIYIYMCYSSPHLCVGCLFLALHPPALLLLLLLLLRRLLRQLTLISHSYLSLARLALSLTPRTRMQHLTTSHTQRTHTHTSHSYLAHLSNTAPRLTLVRAPGGVRAPTGAASPDTNWAEGVRSACALGTALLLGFE